METPAYVPPKSEERNLSSTVTGSTTCACGHPAQRTYQSDRSKPRTAEQVFTDASLSVVKVVVSNESARWSVPAAAWSSHAKP